MFQNLLDGLRYVRVIVSQKVGAECNVIIEILIPVQVPDIRSRPFYKRNCGFCGTIDGDNTAGDVFLVVLQQLLRSRSALHLFSGGFVALIDTRQSRLPCHRGAIEVECCCHLAFVILLILVICTEPPREFPVHV
jgi:hypothetical protein